MGRRQYVAFAEHQSVTRFITEVKLPPSLASAKCGRFVERWTRFEFSSIPHNYA